MSIVVNLQSKAKPETTTKLISFIEEKLPAVRGFSGCMQVSICLNRDSGDLLFYEKWSSKEAHEKYLLNIQNNGVMAQLMSYLSDPPTVNYYESLDI
ncbi:putative quinol monooxygenase [Alkalimarinus coralli]|uniref:putative quinol monooxygenase n=1 Tax=Alkalimarinus coralli TaxID=2935863 RepID=UPI00202ACC43|nr:antibiotic biosynthesis monooxygenase [Alkalimarinus coralli]